ncbi:hypothetical protein M3P05_16385 [Sansalvadorimonas sp. 2012CJ34-2]|uniref:Uncharacterized protein n=1 Tax=Parendozoicomonas callyspongiae TaxID=2942213 RepID=A0ABT0PM16_9GAMM|nr:outer membrane protein OmpK [Sansalvadorimonas sp. 2012CJ34-2]MCL6271498.1 hypothetical protein [Sansalvadorimonas sp. 2012CJ34-2]
MTSASTAPNRIVLLVYLGLTGNGWWFKPWAGIHDLSWSNKSDDIRGSNGYMVGWSAGATFEVAGVPLMVTNWNEIELNRNKEYTKLSHSKTGLNGGIGVWYDINDTF